jgi:hypothetical protein
MGYGPCRCVYLRAPFYTGSPVRTIIKIPQREVS